MAIPSKAHKKFTQSTTPSQAAPGVLSWLAQKMQYILVAVGGLGIFASLVLAIEEFQHLKHPSQSLGCDLNPIIGCGANMDVWQGHVFLGMPNAFVGIIIFTGIFTIGLAMLAGATFRRWFWLLLNGGMVAGLLFVHWFIYESLYVIGHLCPYCMLLWIVTLFGFWYVSLHNLREGHIRVPTRLSSANRFVQRHHADILAVWLLLIVAIILKHFWYYWQTLI